MSSRRYSELKDSEEARKELKEALAEAWENQAKLRELNTGLLAALKNVRAIVANDWMISRCAINRVRDVADPIIAKAETLK